MARTVEISGDFTITDKTPITTAETPPTPAPAQPGGGLLWPKTAEDLRMAWQAALTGGYVLALDPRTNITVSETINLTVGDAGGWTHGLAGNYAKLHSQITDGSPMVLVTSTASCRCLLLERLCLYGGGYDGRLSGGLVVTAAQGLPIYNAKFNDLSISYCTTGLSLIGDIYESEVRSPGIENCFADGLLLQDDGKAVIYPTW